MKSETKKIKSKIYNATKWSALTNIIRKLITPITSMILARLLTPEAFGIVATINIVISFTDIFTEAGFQKYLVQHEFKSEKELEKNANVAFWSNFTLSVFLWIIVAIFSENIAELVGSKGYGFHLSIAAMSIPILSFSTIQESIFKRRFDFKSLFLPKFINSLIPLFITIPLAFIFKNCWALIIGTLAGNLSDAILLTSKSSWKPSLFYSFSILKEMLSFSIWTLLEQISIWFSLNVDVFILSNLLTKHDLGLYKTSITLVNQLTTIITTTILPVLFSALSRKQDDDNSFLSTFYSFQRQCAIVLIPLGIGMVVYRDLITSVMLGKQWMKASIVVGCVGLMQVFRILYSMFASEVYRSKGEPRISFFIQIIYILIIIPLIFVGGKSGFKELCYAKALSMFLFMVLNLLMLKIRYRFSIIQMINNIKEPLFSSLIMGLFGLTICSIFSEYSFQLFSIIICIIIYFSVILIFPNKKKEIKEFAKRMRNQ